MGFVDKIRELDKELTNELLNSIVANDIIYSYPVTLDNWAGSCVIKVPPKMLKNTPFSFGDPVTVFLARNPCDYRAIFGGGVKIHEIKAF